MPKTIVVSEKLCTFLVTLAISYQKYFVTLEFFDLVIVCFNFTKFQRPLFIYVKLVATFWHQIPLHSNVTMFQLELYKLRNNFNITSFSSLSQETPVATQNFNLFTFGEKLVYTGFGSRDRIKLMELWNGGKIRETSTCSRFRDAKFFMNHLEKCHIEFECSHDAY